MTDTFQILILLLAVISVVALIAKRLRVPRQSSWQSPASGWRSAQVSQCLS